MEDAVGGNAEFVIGQQIDGPSAEADNFSMSVPFDRSFLDGADIDDFIGDLFDFEAAGSSNDNIYALSNIGEQMVSEVNWRPSTYNTRIDDQWLRSGSDDQIKTSRHQRPADNLGTFYPQALDNYVDVQMQSILQPPARAVNVLGDGMDDEPGLEGREKVPELNALHMGHTSRVHVPQEANAIVARSEPTHGKPSNRFSKAQTDYLLNWLTEHHGNPYPTSEDISQIQDDTGLETQRIKNWFSRNRKKLVNSTREPHIDPSSLEDRDEGSKIYLLAVDQDGSQAALSKALANSSLTSLQQPSRKSSTSVKSVTDSFRAKHGHTDLHFDAPSDLEISYCEWWLNILADSFEGTMTDGSVTDDVMGYHDEEASGVLGYIVTDAVSHLLAAAAAEHMHNRDFDIIAGWKTAIEAARSGRIPLHAPSPPLQPTRGKKRMQVSQSLSTCGNSFDAYSDMSASSVRSKRRRVTYDNGSYGSVTSGSFSQQSYNSYLPRRGRRLPQLMNARPDPAHTAKDPYQPPHFELDLTLLNTAQKPHVTRKADRKSQVIYQCTCCLKEFKKKNVWERHEAATHYHPVVWICKPQKIGVKWLSCARRPEAERTFYRRDAFKQHLSGWHGMTSAQLRQIDIDSWTQGQHPDLLPLVCHFCGVTPKDWTERTRHVADHFEHGYTMDMWMSTAPKGVDKVKEGVHFAVKKLRNHTIDFADALLEIPILPKIRKSNPLARATANY